MALPATDVPHRATLQAAFRELHGRPLHGFALLLTLDVDRAAILAGEAMAAGEARADDLRHPERAAAWLRARIVRRASAIRGFRRGAGAIAELGADPATVAGLAALDLRSRAALVATLVEGFDSRDVAAIVGREGRALGRLVDRSLPRFLAARADALGSAPPDGPTVELVHATARRAIG